MTIDTFPLHEIYTGLELEFSGTRVIHNTLVPVTFKLQLELAPVDELSGPAPLGNTMQKISYFVEQILDQSVFIHRADESSVAMFLDPDTGYPACANNMVFLHSSATNVAIVEALHSKFQALADDEMMIGFMKITSSDGGGMAITSIGNPGQQMPSIEEFLGSERSYFSKPWWHRDDASTMDVIPAEDANLTEAPEFAYTLNFLLAEEEDGMSTPSRVVRGEFRPKIIQGGKPD